MDLNASPLPEEDEQPYEEHLEGEIIHEEIIESAVATMRRVCTNKLSGFSCGPAH